MQNRTKMNAFLDLGTCSAYDGIQKQNEAIKELVAQRDEVVKKFDESVKDRNDIVI